MALRTGWVWHRRSDVVRSRSAGTHSAWALRHRSARTALRHWSGVAEYNPIVVTISSRADSMSIAEVTLHLLTIEARLEKFEQAQSKDLVTQQRKAAFDEGQHAVAMHSKRTRHTPLSPKVKPFLPDDIIVTSQGKDKRNLSIFLILVLDYSLKMFSVLRCMLPRCPVVLVSFSTGVLGSPIGCTGNSSPSHVLCWYSGPALVMQTVLTLLWGFLWRDFEYFRVLSNGANEEAVGAELDLNKGSLGLLGERCRVG
ncbi:DNA-directed RNA polymerase subunit beta' [Striga asiatica]|uniref:DNA-directed RNA polymerase subunit beta n=1 Tax=Striga asiatica TaxID=4170 RepID=A0A5A7Q8E4_STRAF|nr:DNA-directed RNA polymerase subunit beta' [Striga asiatica]